MDKAMTKISSDDSVSSSGVILRLRSDDRVREREIARVSAVCKLSVMLDRLVILDNAGDWLVSDVRIGDSSQFLHSGDIPGHLFAEGVVDNFARLDLVSAGDRVEVVVVYVGADPEGAVFSAEFRGCEARDDAARYAADATEVDLASDFNPEAHFFGERRLPRVR